MRPVVGTDPSVSRGPSGRWRLPQLRSSARPAPPAYMLRGFRATLTPQPGRGLCPTPAPSGDFHPLGATSSGTSQCLLEWPFIPAPCQTACECVCVCACVCGCECMFLHVCACVCMHVCVCICTCACGHRYVYVRGCVCECAHMCVHVCTCVCICVPSGLPLYPCWAPGRLSARGVRASWSVSEHGAP